MHEARILYFRVQADGVDAAAKTRLFPQYLIN